MEILTEPVVTEIVVVVAVVIREKNHVVEHLLQLEQGLPPQVV